ncbi:hypothetical protein [Streptacidiphilus sp. PAMC 29251]
MDIRPQDLPELRANLVACSESPKGIEWWNRRTFEPASWVEDHDGSVLVVDPSPEQRRTSEMSRLRSADLFYVSDDMTDLAESAAESLPDFRVETFDVPATEGFMVFGHPLHNVIVEHDDTLGHIQGVAWGIASNTDLGLSLWLSFYANLEHDWDSIMAINPGLGRGGAWPKWMYEVDAEWSFAPASAQVSPQNSPLYLWGRTVIAAWLLMQQSLATVEQLEPDRAARKRLRREGHEPAGVRVIELRRPKHTSGEPGESGRNYVHRWITRGHWRQQWYPSREVHRPVWIAPHVKGPEGAPMIGGEKVYAWKR